MVESYEDDKDIDQNINNVNSTLENVKYVIKEHVPSLIIVIGSVVGSLYIT